MAKIASEQLMHGGKGDKKKPSDFPSKSLKQGRKVEREHTDNPRLATEIATDHLTEDPMYYNKLKLIEKKAFIDELMKIAAAFRGSYLKNPLARGIANAHGAGIDALGGIKNLRKAQAGAKAGAGLTQAAAAASTPIQPVARAVARPQ